jgi:hypothetical protein
VERVQTPSPALDCGWTTHVNPEQHSTGASLVSMIQLWPCC